MVCVVTLLRRTNFNATPQAEALEQFLISVLSPGQIDWINHVHRRGDKASVEDAAVYEARYVRKIYNKQSRAQSQSVDEIRLRASLRKIPDKFWQNFVLPTLKDYSQRWNCRFEYHLYAFEQRVIVYYLNSKPSSYRRIQHKRKEYIATFGAETDNPYTGYYYVVKAFNKRQAEAMMRGRFREFCYSLHNSKEEAGVYTRNLIRLEGW